MEHEQIKSAPGNGALMMNNQHSEKLNKNNINNNVEIKTYINECEDKSSNNEVKKTKIESKSDTVKSLTQSIDCSKELFSINEPTNGKSINTSTLNKESKNFNSNNNLENKGMKNLGNKKQEILSEVLTNQREQVPSKPKTQQNNSKMNKNIPGLAYIITIKARSNSANCKDENSKNSGNLFDCVLCNIYEKVLNWSEVKSHIFSLQHLLNVLEVDYYPMYLKYRNDANISPATLYNIIIELAPRFKKRVFTFIEEFKDKREKLASTITQLRSLNGESSIVSVLETSEGIIEEEPTAENSLNSKQENKKSLNTRRSPKNLVIASDGRYTFLKIDNCKNVKIFKAMNLKFENILEIMQKHKIVGKGSLIVAMFGIYSLVNQSVVHICKRNNCKKPLLKHSLIPEMSSDVLISKALKLHEYVKHETSNDVVLFCEIIPIPIVGTKSYCENKHMWTNYIPNENYTEHLKVIEKYNQFVRDHARMIGMKSWNLLTNAFPSGDKMDILNCSHDYEKVDHENLTKYIRNIVKETAISLTENEKTVDEIGTQPSLIQKSNICKSIDIDSHLSGLVAEEKDRKSKQIVLILDENIARYLTFSMEDFNNYVKIINIGNFSFGNLIDKLQSEEVFGKDSLFVVMCGIFSLVSTIIPYECQKNNCAVKNVQYVHCLDMTSRKLISMAIEFHEFVLKNTVNDRVMLCELIPISFSGTKIKQCSNLHNVINVGLPRASSCHLKLVQNYNSFVERHCLALGHKKLDLLLNSLSNDNTKLASYPLNNLYDYTNINSFLLCDYVKTNLSEILNKHIDNFIPASKGTVIASEVAEELPSEEKKSSCLEAEPNIEAQVGEELPLEERNSSCLEAEPNIEAQVCEELPLKEIKSACLEAVPNVKTQVVDKGQETKILLKSKFKQRIETMVKRQIDRYPNQVVLVHDRSWKPFITNEIKSIVKVFNCGFSNFNNIMKFLKENKILGKGSLLILMIGTYSFIREEIPSICKSSKCENKPVMYYVIPSMDIDSIISQVLFFQENLLKNTDIDQVMLCDLIPIYVDTKLMKCSNKHAARNVMHKDIYSKYLKKIEEFNSFVDFHCKSFQLEKFSLSKNTLSTIQNLDCNSSPNFTTVDAQSLSNIIISKIGQIAKNVKKKFSETTIETRLMQCKETQQAKDSSCLNLNDAINSNNNNDDDDDVVIIDVIKRTSNAQRSSDKHITPPISKISVGKADENCSVLPQDQATTTLKNRNVSEASALETPVLGKTPSPKSNLSNTKISVIENVISSNLLNQVTETQPSASNSSIIVGNNSDKSFKISSGKDKMPCETNSTPSKTVQTTSFGKNNSNNLIVIPLVKSVPTLNTITSSSSSDCGGKIEDKIIIQPCKTVKEDTYNTFERIVIFADSQYFPYTDFIQRSRVTIIDDKSNSFNIISLIKKEQKLHSEKTLYIHFTGILSIVKKSKYECQRNGKDLKCEDYSLSTISPFDKGSDINCNMKKSLTSLINQVNSILENSSAFTILPPFPPSIISIGLNFHCLHNIDRKELFKYFICSFKDIETFKANFFQYSMGLTLFANYQALEINANNEPLKIYCSIVSNWNDHLTVFSPNEISAVKRNSVSEKFKVWSNAVDKFLFSCLNSVKKSFYLSSSLITDISSTKVDMINKFPSKDIEIAQNISNYDHIVFVTCSEDQVELLPEADNHISVINGNSCYDWRDIKNKIYTIEPLKSSTNALFVIFGSAKILANEEIYPRCISAGCKESLKYLDMCSLEPYIVIQKTKNNLQTLTKGIEESYCNAKIIFIPFYPTTVVEVVNNTHVYVHKLLLNMCKPSIVCGRKHRWEKLFALFKIEWEEEMYFRLRNTKKEIKGLIKDVSKSITGLHWINILLDSDGAHIEKPPKSYQDLCKFKHFLNNLALLVHPTNYKANTRKLSAPTFFLHLPMQSEKAYDIVQQNKGNCSEKSYSSELPFKKISNDEILEISNKETPESKMTDVKITDKETPCEKKSEGKQSFEGTDKNCSEGIFNGKMKGKEGVSESNKLMVDSDTLVKYSDDSNKTDNDKLAISVNKQIEEKEDKATLENKITKQIIDKSFVNKTSDFMFSFKDVSFISDKITFDHIYILCKKDLHSSIDENKISNVEFIFYNNAKLLEIDIPDLIQKMPKKNSACLFMLDIKYFLKVDFAMLSCLKNNCGCPVFVQTLDIKENMDSVDSSKIRSSVMSKVMNVVTFIAKLSVHLPVLAMPLFPSRICSIKNITDHEFIHHHSSFPNFYFASENSNWKVLEESLAEFWSNALENNNNRYFRAETLRNSIIDLGNLTFESIWETKPEIARLNAKLWRDIYKAFINILSLRSAKSNIPVLTSSRMLKKVVRETTGIRNFSTSFLPQIVKKKLKGKSSCEDQSVLVIIWDHSTQDEISVIQPFNCVSKQTTVLKYEDHIEIGVPSGSTVHVFGILKELVDKYPQIKYCVLEEKVFTLMKFKTAKCEGFCSQGLAGRCFYYHDMSDKRRIPMSSFNMIKYNATICSAYPVLKPGDCVKGESSCTFCHNIFELYFHPSLYQSKLCQKKKNELCDWQTYCSFAHEDTPEMFYNKEWKDLIVFGTENSFKFTIGAVLGFTKIVASLHKVKVIFMSPSLKMLNIMKMVIFNVFGENLRTVIVGETTTDLEHTDVFLGTPSLLLNSSWNLFCRTDIKAFVVDNALKILEDSVNKLLLIAAVKQINGFSVVNKVFVSECYDSKTAGYISTLLEIPLKEVKPKEIENNTRQTKVEVSDIEAFISSCRLRSEVGSTDISKDVRDDQESSKSKGHGVKRSLSKSKSPLNSFSENQNKKICSEKRSSSNSSLSRTTIMKEESKESSPKNHEKGTHRSRKKSKSHSKKRHRSKTKIREKESSSKSRKKSRKSRKKEKNHENEEKLDYDQKKTSLPKELSPVSRIEGPSSSSPSINEDSLNKARNEFSLPGTLALLVAVKDKLGILGSAVYTLIKSANENEENPTKLWNLFNDEENVILLNMIVDKLKGLLLTSPSHDIPVLTKSAEWVQKLIEEAKKKSELKVADECKLEVSIDLNSVALASLNKSPDDILQLIKTAFAYEGKVNPSKEEIHHAYLQVCYLHFELTVKDSS